MIDDDILTRTLCIEITDFPDVTEAGLEEKARAIGRDLMDRLGRKLEWGQVVTFRNGKSIGVALLLARGCEQNPELAESVFAVVCEHTGVELKGSGRKKPKGGPRVGLGPRFPAEFYESHGRKPFREVRPFPIGQRSSQ